MINITFPDKSVKKYESSINGLELAKSISNSLAKSAVCIEINGELKDLSYLIEEDSVCKIFTKDDQYSLDTLRHSTAHVLAQAVLNLYPGTEFAVGPSIDDGFYYDFLFKENCVYLLFALFDGEAVVCRLSSMPLSFVVCRRLPLLVLRLSLRRATSRSAACLFMYASIYI